MSELIQSTHELLMRMYREEDAIFSYSAREVAGEIVNDFDHPGTLRYTINCLAGLQAAVSRGRVDWPVGHHLERFLSLHGERVSNPADQGLLLMVLAKAGHSRADTLFSDMARIVSDPRRLATLDLQDLSWMLTGLTAYTASSGERQARDHCDRLFRFIDRRLLDKRTMLPRYRAAGWRRSFSSFGGIAYFLHACADYSDAFADAYADSIFREATTQVMALQGANGAWPWFIDTRRAKVLDWYPVYSVHQDSMAMLFLFPALDRHLEGARDAIDRSWRWLVGDNELRRTMLRTNPFFIDRAIRRKEPATMERARRYARGARVALTRSAGRPADASRLAVVEECRSYHLGWILYTWSSRGDAGNGSHG